MTPQELCASLVMEVVNQSSAFEEFKTKEDRLEFIVAVIGGLNQFVLKNINPLAIQTV